MRAAAMAATLPILASVGCKGVPTKKSLSADEAASNGAIVQNEVTVSKPRKEKQTPKTKTDFAQLEVQMNHPEKAEKFYREAIELDAKYAPAYAGLAQLYHSKNQIEKAMEVVQTGLKKKPKASELWNELAMIKQTQKDPKAAIEAMRKAVEYSPDSDFYRTNLAGMLAYAGDYKESIALYSKVMPPAEARYKVAGAMYRNGHKSDSVAMLRSALLEDPNNQEIAKALSKLSMDSPIQQAAHTYAEPSPLPVEHQAPPPPKSVR
jgi:tetratricopeptide (TPR) repeat protein